jgi:S-DNA-T family DNA segregation ATPase FtsK/SpoIIIE
LIDSIKAQCKGAEAPHMSILPETFTYDMFSDYDRDDSDIFLGLDNEEVQLRGFIHSASPFVIIGESGRGKTNAIKIVLSQVIEGKEKPKVYLFDSANMELYSYASNNHIEYMTEEVQKVAFLENIQKEVDERKENLEKMLKENPGMNPKLLLREMKSSVIIIDDVDDFTESFKPDLSKVANVLKDAVGVGITCIVTVHAGKPRGIDDVTKVVKQTSNGLVLSAQGGAAPIFPVMTASLLPRFGDGLLFKNGSFVRIKLPQMIEQEE